MPRLKVTKFGYFALLMSFVLISTAKAEVTMPEIHFFGYRAQNACAALLETLDTALVKGNWQQIERIINFANKEFERRGWPKEFLAERIVVARKYKDRSAYATAKDKKTRRLRGTLGLTFAKYSSESSIAEAQILPMEDTLQTTLGRPLSKNGEGIIFEFRTYAIKRNVNKATYSLLVRDILPVLFDWLKPYPDLYDKPVVYTYADRASLKLYGWIGFELSPETPLDKPILHDGLEWWKMVATPKTIEARAFSVVGPRLVSNLNQSHPFKLPNGLLVSAMPNTEMTINDDGSPGQMVLSETVEVAPNIFAKGGEEIGYDDGKKFPTSLVLAKPVEFDQLDTEVP